MKKTITTIFALAMLGACATTLAQDATPAQDEPQPIVGNAASGERRASMCIGCHGIEGYKNAFPELHHIPMISGQNAEFIEAALNAYRSGDRRHPTMRAVAQALNDQDIADLAAFYSTNSRRRNPAPLAESPSVQPSARVARLIEQGDCISCHGANFSTALDPTYPKIAGQHADYLYVAMKAYTIDNNPIIGRTNPVMAGVARQFTLEEMRELARYMGQLDGNLEVVPQSGFRLFRSNAGE